MKILITVFLLSMVIISGCASAASKTFELALGMEEQDVKQIMGEPESRFNHRDQSVVRYLYRLDNGFGVGHPYAVFFKDGKLAGMGYVRSGGNSTFQNLPTTTFPNPNAQPIYPAILSPYWR